MFKTKLKDTVRAFAGKRVAVIGDLMLDAYTWGNATRISPEAPVPIVAATRENCVLGGAGNVMRNIVTLGGRATAYGVLGNDLDGGIVRDLLASYGIDHSTVLADNSRRTSRKQRVLAGSQQLLRIDFEDTFELECKTRERLCELLLTDIKQHRVDAVLFEDYGKGVLSSPMVQTLVDAARAENIITALDPKPGNLSPVRGITVMKPNRGEAFSMSGVKPPPADVPVEQDEALKRVAAKIQAEWQVEQLLVSLAAQGLALFRQGSKVVVIPTKAREVFDVSGAGDTLIGAYTLALAAGAPPEIAAQVGNFAAGVVVGKVGTVKVSKDELIRAIDEDGR